MTASNLQVPGLIQDFSAIRSENSAAPHSDKRPSLQQNIELIKKSYLFDYSFYANAIGATELSEDELIEHYLLVGEPRGVSPSLDFDVNFYTETNPDVIKDGVSPLLHYIEYGQSESRYPNHEMLSRDASQVQQSILFEQSPLATRSPVIRWLRAGLRRNQTPDNLLKAIERNLTSWRLGHRINDFDAKFYWTVYPDLHRFGKPPLIHYIEIGHRQGRFVSRAQLNHAVGRISAAFDEQYYRRIAKLADADIDAAEHYLTVGQFSGLAPSADFHADYYLRLYPDVAQAGVDPYLHFVLHGVPEGRLGRPNFANGLVSGTQSFDRAKPTIVIVNHDSSRTGAPIVGLTLARHLSSSWNVLCYCGRAGPLVDDFAAASVCTVVGPTTPLDAEYLLDQLRTDFGAAAVVINSVECSPFADAALYARLPSVVLLHEFAEYTFPAGKMPKVIAAADRVVVPAQIILESVQKAVKREFGEFANNITIHPQGRIAQLPGNRDRADLTAADILARLNISGGTKPPIVLAAGFIHMRKGVELFVETANVVRRHLGNDVRFVWVGDGYEPTKDINYSVWISQAIERLSLQDIVHFFEPQGSLDTLFELADVFYLPSRLDPFPNVVLDALSAGKQVVCFEGATGAADLFGKGLAHGAAVEYCNVDAAASALMKIMRERDRNKASANRRLVEEKFRFGDYARFIEQEVSAAISNRATIELSSSRIAVPDAFDADFHEGHAVGHFAAMRACRDYAARQSKGLRKYNPRPGFSDGYYRSRHALADRDVALDHALRSMSESGEPPATHRCVILRKGAAERLFPGRIALHIHLHYAELAQHFADRLSGIGQPIDVFITTTSAEKHAECERSFERYGRGTATVIDVPNRGRDIGPFLTRIPAAIRNSHYDVVGHLHGKRSLIVDETMGERWRTYLLDTLLGPHFSQLINIFADDPDTGLVFAEDRHSAGWDANYDVAQHLALRLAPSPPLSKFPPPFPLGTMFWARPAAVDSLWRLDLQDDDFPREPLPYDGTILHAIERILPAVCDAAGFSWCTVYDKNTSW